MSEGKNIHRCGYCRFARARAGQLECHKSPPAADWYREKKMWLGIWPPVDETDWCGSFEGDKVWEKLMDERRSGYL